MMNPHYPSTHQGASTGAELFTLDGKALPLVASTLRAEAEGGIARLVLEQAFVNSFDETLRVTYRMPLPAEGAVSGYAFEIAGRVIKGVVDRKQQARERFERAIASGHTAALLEQERADIFTQEIGNIPAGETLIARITIDQRLAWLPEGEWELRFPTVIGPRYCGTAETINDARATHVKVATEDLGVRLQIELAIKDAISGGRAASSTTHKLARKPDGTITLSTGTRLDRDLVVRWPVAKPEVGAHLSVARPGDAAEAFGLLSIVPPAQAAKVVPVPRDLIVLLDTSGSMGGGPLEKAKQVVCMLIDSLGDDDRIELIEFSNSPRRYKDEPERATAQVKAAAIKWVRSRTADGGTEIRQAVVEALHTLRIGAQRQVIAVTDGYVGGEQQILRVLHDSLPASCRLHVLGVGSAVNRSLATALARAGRGAEVIVGIDEDAERGAKRLLDRTRMPVLTNVEIFGSALVRAVPEHCPDVFEGAPLLAALELRPDGGDLTIRGQLARETFETTIKVPPTKPGDGNAALAALFGRERVADLEARSAIEEVNAEIEALGLRFQIATRLTSWVAVDERVRVEPGTDRHEVVPQEVPYGTSAAAFGLRPGQVPPMQAASPMKTMAFTVGSASYAAEESDFDDEEVSRSSVRTRSGVIRGPLAGSAAGGPPGAPRSAPPRPAAAAPAPPAPAQPKRAEPERKKEADEAPAAEKAKTVMLGRPSAPSPAAMPSMPEPVKPAAPKKSRAPWIALAIIAALIAALVWLLLR